MLPRDIVKRPFHFVSAVSFATAVLSFLFRSQGMLQSSGGEIGKLIKAPQGRALESVSLRGQFQNPVNKQGLHKTTVLGIAGRDASKDKLSPRAASQRMCSSISGGTTASWGCSAPHGAAASLLPLFCPCTTGLVWKDLAVYSHLKSRIQFSWSKPGLVLQHSLELL